MDKVCIVCKIKKPVSDFRKNRTRKDGYHSCCSECDKKRQREWYLKNKVRLIKKAVIRSRIARNICRGYIIDYLQKHPCRICGESDIIVLDFDHIDESQKEYNIGSLVARSNLNQLKKEILKCQVLCANCHRRKTAKDHNWAKARA